MVNCCSCGNPPNYDAIAFGPLLLCRGCFHYWRLVITYGWDQHKPEGDMQALTWRIERALLARHPVTLPPDRARNYAELAAFVVQGGS